MDAPPRIKLPAAPVLPAHLGTRRRSGAGVRARRQSELRQEHALQRAHRPAPEGRQLPRRHRREEDRRVLIRSTASRSNCIDLPGAYSLRGAFAGRGDHARRAARPPHRNAAARPRSSASSMRPTSSATSTSFARSSTSARPVIVVAEHDGPRRARPGSTCRVARLERRTRRAGDSVRGGATARACVELRLAMSRQDPAAVAPRWDVPDADRACRVGAARRPCVESDRRRP